MNPCVKKMVEITKGALTESQASKMFHEIHNQATTRAAKDHIPYEDAVKAVALEKQQHLKMQNAISKRAAVLGLRARNNWQAYVKRNSHWDKNLTRKIEVTERDQQFEVGLLLSKFTKMIEAAGVVDEFKSQRKFQYEVVDEMWNLSQKEPISGSVSGNATAHSIARAFFDTNRDAFLKKNLYGAHIQAAPGWAFPQTHDAMIIRAAGGETTFRSGEKKASYQAWRKSFDDNGLNVDWDRTTAGQDKEEWLKEFHAHIYDQVYSDDADADPNVYNKIGSEAKKVSSERKLWFADSKSQLRYNELWGKRNLYDAMMSHLIQSGKSIGLMKSLGPNPMANFQAIQQNLVVESSNADLPSKTVTTMKSQKYEERIQFLSGRASSTTNAHRSRFFDNIASLNLLSKGANIVISTFGDRVFTATDAYANGVKGMDTLGAALATSVKNTSGWRKVHESFGLYSHSIAGGIASRWINEDKLSGFLSGGVNKMYNITGLNRMTDIHQHGAGDIAALQVGRETANPFDKLDPLFRRGLEDFGFTSKDWELIRKATWKLEDTWDVVTPADIENLPRELFSSALEQRDLASKLGAYNQERVRNGVPQPNVTARTFMTGGAKPRGDWGREMLNPFFTFKGFPIAAAMSITRNIKNLHAGKHYQKGIFYVANLIAQSFVAGYVITTIKDTLKGRTPRRLMDEDGSINYSVLFNSLKAGGGLGIYGDFLFSEYDRHYRTIPAALAGPIYGSAFDAYTLGSQAIRGLAGDEKIKMESLGFEAFRQAEANAPFINMFYIKPVLDYLIWWHVKEGLSPGVIRRQMQSVEDKNHQEFWLEPVTY